jgi:hypothetical protein
MRPMRHSATSPGTRSNWEPPAVTKLAIGRETKSARENEQSTGLKTSGSGQASLAQPQPPTAPATKLGFSFEWAFPLSARME